jgi:uncharacterized protein
MTIIPELTDLTRPYWENAREGRLVIQRCDGCANSWHPPLSACPHCHGTGIGWHQVAGSAITDEVTILYFEPVPAGRGSEGHGTS